MAEDFWTVESGVGSGEPLQSDFWEESDGEGTAYHLRAVAVTDGDRHLLLLERPEADFNELRQAQLYMHQSSTDTEKIERLNQAVERATQAKSEFLASMSHEIRTPLNAILGMADLLAETALNGEQRKYVEVFQRAGANLLGLINDILDLSKVEAGHLELEAVDFELREVIGRVLELTRVKATAKGLEVGSALGAAVPPVVIGDPTRLRQILLNLLGNGMKFTDRGRLEVTVEQDPDDGRPGSLRFGVRDTGIGIPPDKLVAVFENFAQADSSTTRKYGGTGLGLAISKRLVEMMDGRIWVESVMGSGSTFFFTVKLGVSARTAVSETRSERPVVELVKVHVLLADDSEDNRFLIREYLKGTPVVLQYAENGEVALRKMKSCHFDLVLMDSHMPVMDGHAATRAMRAWEAERGLHRLPILALTADAFQSAREQSAAAGFDAHLTKPIGKVSVVEAIQRYALACDQPNEEPAKAAAVDAAVASLAPRYLKNLGKEVGSLRIAAAVGDWATIQRIGHNLHGTGTSFGFPEVTICGAAMEQAAKDGHTGAMQEAIEKLAGHLELITAGR